VGLVDWRIVVAVGALALLIALIGLRGRKADALPRCKRRRCRYDLSAFIGETRPGEKYPVTCPECGRVARGEREVKWGRRRARKRVVWVGAVVLALCAMVGGVEVYARASNANTLAWMPLWLIMDRAEGDTYQNAYPHQSELLRRADAGEITGPAAKRVIARVLEWQQDDTVFWGVLGDVFASLALNGEATPEDITQFWANVWEFEVVARPTVERGSVPTVRVHGHWRGHWRRQLIYLIEEGDDLWLPSHFGPSPFVVPVTVTVSHGEEVIPLELAHDGRLFGRGGDGYFGPRGFVSVWWMITPTGAWDVVRGLNEPYTVSIEGVAFPPSQGETLLDGSTLSPADEIASAGLRASWPVSGEARIEPLPWGDASIELVKDAALGERLAAASRAILRVYQGRPIWIEVSLGDPAKRFSGEPLDEALSFTVIIRSPDGRESVEGGPWVSRTLPTFANVTSTYAEDPRLLNDPSLRPKIILRADPKHALRTTDITRIWDGEIEIQLEVDIIPPGAAFPAPGEMSKPPAQATAPAPASAPTPAP
jgi:hypothetical protein